MEIDDDDRIASGSYVIEPSEIWPSAAGSVVGVGLDRATSEVGTIPGETVLSAAEQNSENAHNDGVMVDPERQDPTGELRPHWLQVSAGRLAFGSIPGHMGSDEIDDADISHVLTLLTETKRILQLGESIEAIGLSWLRYSVPSAGFPEEVDDRLLDLLFDLRSALNLQGSVYIHDSPGASHAGMLTYALLRSLRFSVEDAISWVSLATAGTTRILDEQSRTWGDQFAVPGGKYAERSRSSYRCPICFWYGLGEDPNRERLYQTYEICSCCGFEFGYEIKFIGRVERAKELREEWLAKGAPFFFFPHSPDDWSLERAQRTDGALDN